MENLQSRARRLLRAFGADPRESDTTVSLPFILEGMAGVVMLIGVDSDWTLCRRVSLAMTEVLRVRRPL